jgi:hypothetical protein
VARVRVSGGWVEGLALLAIAAAVTFGGRAMLAELHAFGAIALVPLGLGIAGVAASLRRARRDGASRLTISMHAAYLTALALAIIAVIVPARWSAGATIAMIDIAVAFDLFARSTKSAAR